MTLPSMEIHRRAEIQLQPVEEPTLEQERSVKRPALEERAAETTCEEQITVSIAHLPALLR